MNKRVLDKQSDICFEWIASEIIVLERLIYVFLKYAILIMKAYFNRDTITLESDVFNPPSIAYILSIFPQKWKCILRKSHFFLPFT